MSEKPSKIKVGAHEYNVVYDDLLYDRAEQQEYLGRVTYQETRIEIKTGRSPSQVAETVLHEVVHAVSIDRKLDLSEHQVDQVAAGLLAVIVDNPELFGRQYLEQFKEEQAV